MSCSTFACPLHLRNDGLTTSTGCQPQSKKNLRKKNKIKRVSSGWNERKSKSNTSTSIYTYFVIIEFCGTLLRDCWYHFGEINASGTHFRLQIIPFGLKETTGHRASGRCAGNCLQHLHHFSWRQCYYMRQQSILEPIERVLLFFFLSNSLNWIFQLKIVLPSIFGFSQRSQQL